MTDQGALERARPIDDVRDWHRIAKKKNEGMTVGFDTISALLAEIDAAASEARAAAIEQCIGTLDGYKQGIIDNEDWPDQDAELLNTLDSAIHMLRALVTPATQETTDG